MEKYDPEFVRRILEHYPAGTEVEKILYLAEMYGKKIEMEAVLRERKKRSLFRSNGKSLIDLLEETCTRRDDLVKYNSPQVHDYDEKHLLVEGLSAVDVEGKVIESYPQLLVMKDVFRDAQGKLRYFAHYQAIKHCEQEGYFLPPTQITCAIVAACFQHKDNPEANKVLMQYKDKGNGNGWHVQNTVVAYGKSNIISYPHDTDFHAYGGTDNINASHVRTELPFNKSKGIWPVNKNLKSMILEDGLKNPLEFAFVKQFTGLQGSSILVEIGKYFGKTAQVWVSSSYRTRAAWFGCNSISLDLEGDGLDGSGATRGVREL